MRHLAALFAISLLLLVTACTQKVSQDIEVWNCLEIPFAADKTYNNPLLGDEFCEMDVVFTHTDGTVISRPAFWDGENVFKVRFAPTKAGKWSYITICGNDKALDGQKGTVKTFGYSGDLAVYKHGFLTISDNCRYFTHNDGTPFFYLGDTHWSLPFEAFESSNIPGIESQFKYIVDTRIEQGFTVFQSEPIQAKNLTGKDLTYNLSSFGPEDLGGFANLDRKFKYLADKGMVHANAQLFFTYELAENNAYYSDEYLDKLARYWVARYGAYPVMWTTAQEADNDFYFERPSDQKVFDSNSNPWKKVLKSIYKYDAYRHPLTAHMEYAWYDDAVNNGGGTIASNSSFNSVEGHNWFAAQWSPPKDGGIDFRLPKDFWDSKPTKPTVNYEGQYDHFWTNTFGARMQGWTAYLNGMFGYGYGCAGIWLILNEYPDDAAGLYDLDNDSSEELTKEVKRTPWNKSLFLPAAEQMGKVMRPFFESMEWWRLTPRFNDEQWSSLGGSFYSLATIDNDVYVAYFYNKDTQTGSLKNLAASKNYTAQWYNPQTGTYTPIGEVKVADNAWTIPPKPDNNDWVLLVIAGIV